MKRFLPILGFVAATLVAALAFAEPSTVPSFAERLAALRAEVEDLSSQVEQAKETRRAEQRSFAAQKADLEFQIQREQARLVRLRAQVDEQKQLVADSSKGAEELQPALDASFELLRNRIRGSLPFKTTERLGAVDELEQRVRGGLVTPQKAAVQLWALVEDEMRLGRENGMYRQVIELNGDEVLVEVARLGMVRMYFRTDDGQVGYAEQRDGKWAWTAERDEIARRQIDGLFESLRKGVRTGYFELPGIPGGAQ